MDGRATGGILRAFDDLPDPRARNVTHRLHDMIVIAACAVICGAGGWAEVEVFGNSKLAWFKTTCPTGCPATTRSAGSSPASTPTPSSGGSSAGSRPWPARRAGS